MAIASKFLPRVKKKVISVEKLLDGSVAAEKKKIMKEVLDVLKSVINLKWKIF